MNTFWNVVLILAGSAVAVGGIFGEGYDRALLAQSKWWQVRKYVTARGWFMLVLTCMVIGTSIWKYQHDFADAVAKEAQLTTERDEWKKKGDERAKSTQVKLDALSAENAGLRLDLKTQGEEFVRHLASLKEQNDGLAGRSEALRRQLEELKKDSEGMVLATALAGSTTSASVLKASTDLQSEIKTSAVVLHDSVTQYDDALFHLVSDMQQKDVAPIHGAIDRRGRSDDDFPTLRNVREECASPAEIEAALRSPAAKAICPACSCSCTAPATPSTADTSKLPGAVSIGPVADASASTP